MAGDWERGCLHWTDDNGFSHVMRGPREALEKAKGELEELVAWGEDFTDIRIEVYR